MSDISTTNRRGFLAGGAGFITLAAAGCTATTQTVVATQPALPSIPDYARMMYRAMPEEASLLPAFNLTRLDPRNYLQEVRYATTEAPGTVIVDTPTAIFISFRRTALLCDTALAPALCRRRPKPSGRFRICARLRSEAKSLSSRATAPTSGRAFINRQRTTTKRAG